MWWHSFVFAALFGIMGIALSIIGYKLFDWISPIDVEKELAEKQNVAVAIVVGSFIVGVCFIIGRAVGS
ncbi:MAG TPA: DUF350 domain-containing protein [Tepidisphaeraceae bacterium]|nr:DUF350 domain-containing protein [Tepidisphaeraceae bacterium]